MLKKHHLHHKNLSCKIKKKTMKTKTYLFIGAAAFLGIIYLTTTGKTKSSGMSARAKDGGVVSSRSK